MCWLRLLKNLLPMWCRLALHLLLRESRRLDHMWQGWCFLCICSGDAAMVAQGHQSLLCPTDIPKHCCTGAPAASCDAAGSKEPQN